MVHAYMFDAEALAFARHDHRRAAATHKVMRPLLPGLRGQIGAGESRPQVEPARRLLGSPPLGRRYVLERGGEIVGMGCLAYPSELMRRRLAH